MVRTKGYHQVKLRHDWPLRRQHQAQCVQYKETRLEMRRIIPSDLAVGQPLPWDVFGDGGGLLVRKGHVIASANQIDNLVERGMIAQEETVHVACEPPSVLRMLNVANSELETVLGAIARGKAVDAHARLTAIAHTIVLAVELHPDVALACILHNQHKVAYAIRHSVDSAVVALVVARAMKKPPADILTVMRAALTMNVGMLQHQQRMQGSRAPLSEADAAVIHDHPTTSAAMLRRAGIEDQGWLDCVLLHHESENGSGYPFGKTADQIPESAKMVSLADRYCARVSGRTYRKPMLPNAALRDILIEGKSTIDAQLAAVFIRELGIYPIGTLVRLLNGEIGVVTRKGLNTTTPIVDALVGPRGAPLDVIIRRDTKEERHAIREVLNEDQAAIGFRLDQLWGRVASA